MKHWIRVKKFNADACLLADRHYSRRTPGSNQFMPPGETIVLLSKDKKAVFGWWRPHPDSGITAMNGFDGWTCTIFRNEGDILSSELVLDAEKALEEYDIGPDGLLTYVYDSKIASKNPGFCFKKAGYTAVGRSKDGKKTLLQKKLPNHRADPGQRRLPWNQKISVPKNGENTSLRAQNTASTSL